MENDTSDIGSLTTVPSSTVYDNRFIISTSEVATLIIKNVADISDATFERRVGASVDAWKYKIRVEIAGEIQDLSCIHYGNHSEIVFVTNKGIDL